MTKSSKKFMNEKWFLQYYDQVEIEKGEKIFFYNDGKKEGILETAKEMIKDNVDIKKIVQYTGLSLKEIQDLML